MANNFYTAARVAFLDGGLAWGTDTIKLVLADDADYTPNLGTHDGLDDIPGAARVATSGAFTSKTSTGGVADAADVTLASVSGDTCELIVIFLDTGTEATSTLIVLIDTATGLPVTPNGGNIDVQWDSGANRIFTLGRVV